MFSHLRLFKVFHLFLFAMHYISSYVGSSRFIWSLVYLPTEFTFGFTTTDISYDNTSTKKRNKTSA